MEITTETLEAQIEAWQNDKNQTLARLNYLEGAIQSHRVILAQIENGAGADIPAPEDKQEQSNAVENSDSNTEEKGSAGASGVDAQNGNGVGDVAADKRQVGRDIETVGSETETQVKSKSKA